MIDVNQILGLCNCIPAFLMQILCFNDSEREARASCGSAPAEPEAAGLSQQGGAASAPEIHVCCSQTGGGQTAQRGQR